MDEVKISDLINQVIEDSVKNFDGTYGLTVINSFEELISMGELVDRLSIVNFKLYTLKNEVMKREGDKEFAAWATIEDVRLVEERARLKRCIDEKLSNVIERIVKTGDSGFNAESKLYE